MDWVVRIGLIELAIGGLLGWAMVVRDERPEWLRRIGVVAPQRIRQVHLDYVMMGLILIGVGLAVPDLPTAVAAALVFGTFVNPFLFVPLAFDPDAEKRLWYRAVATVSFIAVSGGLVVAAIVGPRSGVRPWDAYAGTRTNAASAGAESRRMPTMKKLSLVLSALVLAVLLAVPAAAQATLAFVRNPLHPAVFVAGDDGSGAKKLVAGGEAPPLARRQDRRPAAAGDRGEEPAGNDPRAR